MPLTQLFFLMLTMSLLIYHLRAYCIIELGKWLRLIKHKGMSKKKKNNKRCWYVGCLCWWWRMPLLIHSAGLSSVVLWIGSCIRMHLIIMCCCLQESHPFHVNFPSHGHVNVHRSLAAVFHWENFLQLDDTHPEEVQKLFSSSVYRSKSWDYSHITAMKRRTCAL